MRFAAILTEVIDVIEVEAAGIRRGGNAAVPALLRHALQIVEPAVAEHFDVTHHVRVGNGDKTLGFEKFTDLDLVGQRFLGGHALLAAQNRLLLGVEFHVWHLPE